MGTLAEHASTLRRWLPPWRVALVAESAIATTWLLLLAVQDEWEDWRAALAVFAISQPLLIPALSAVSRSAGDDSRATLALRLWARTIFAGFVLSVIALTIAAAATGPIGTGFGMLFMSVIFGGVMLALMTALFVPALWITAVSIEHARS